MKKLNYCLLLFGLLFLAPSLKLKAQDTTWVQTYTFDTLWTRRANFFFPTADESYRKILMYFNIKCYPDKSGDGNYACGEWDYIYFNSIYDHRGKLDSTLKKGRYFTVNDNGNIDTLRYAPQPQYNVNRSFLYNTVVDNVTSATSFNTGTGTVPMAHPFSLSVGRERSQFIWKASELLAAGLTAGNITGIQLNFQNSAGMINNVMIRMKQVTADSFTVKAMENDTLKTVYNYHRNITTAGLNSFQFSTPFVWDGTSNILIDFSFQNATTGTGASILGQATTIPSGLFSTTTNYAMGSFGNTGGNVRFDPSLNMFAGTAPRTYDMWINVDSFIGPEGTLFSAGLRGTASADFTFRTTTPDNSYRLNLWGTNDANFSGPNTKKVWKHLAVTYANDTFRFYMNGALAYTKYRPGLSTATAGDFLLGESREGGYFYLGKFSHLRIWDKALSGADIRNWVGRDITASHPDFSHLKADYRLNTGTLNTIADVSPAAQHQGLVSGNMWWQAVKARDIYYNAQTLNWRPQIVFERNTYTSHIDSVAVNDTVYTPPVLVKFYGNPGGNHIIQDNDPANPAIYTATRSAWTNAYGYIFQNGVKVDSFANARDSMLVNYNINWYSNTVKYEIGRSISPYGINLSLGNGRTRVYDVTDYYALLQDTVDLEVGGTQEIQDVKFAFIKGQPAAEVNRILQPWGKGWAQYKYGAIASDTVLSPMTLNLLPNTGAVKFRSYVTGHGGAENAGSGYPNGCCEFMFNNHYYKSNGQNVNTFRIQRQDCGLNPIYPQGGTWVYDREGWCPGDIIKPHDFNVTQYMSGSQINLDYNIAPVPTSAPNTGNGVYDVGLQVIEYKTPARNNDAEIYDIVKPSDAFAVSRVNPICHTPQVIIRNSGKNPLTAAVIKYKVAGGNEETLNWTGNLKFLDTALVDLPISNTGFWAGNQSNRFIARIAGANGGSDEYAGNDTAYSSYNLPDILPSGNIVVRLKTNKRAVENTLRIKDASGTTVFERTGMSNETQYSDTLALPLGCYTFVLDDAGNNGLDWWAAASAGKGTLSLTNATSGATLKTFNPDFGAQVFYSFTIGFSLKLDDKNFDNLVTVYPNPNQGKFTVQMQGFSGDVALELTNMVGQSLWHNDMKCMGSMVKKEFTPQLPPGVYLLRMSSGNTQSVKKLVIQ
ncbi:LamG-like jellyroll fold domain-containing protein [Taibaiella chishuiensis]|uniref:Putative secreted protein (Por secretion system target) n=1 Tax=Taibaiella chishuiensis TaxID=1434707 RepID=A0A2P8D5L6_9BACT|nr:LamG-like jellyroll fold domain-containing protein [Taibaiella chishuiensis]PSK92488.1 putative secreted protein (Por secretion system target) [Taibaiella chishuiensis]